MAVGTLKPRRYLNINDGYMQERIDENTTHKHNHISHAHLIGITFRKVEKEENGAKKFVGETIQLHLLDADDYFVVETWINSRYAKSFYMVMESIDFAQELMIMTSQKIKDGKKQPALFVQQFGSNLKWNYVKDNMKECPEVLYEKNADETYTVNDTEQQMFFLEKLEKLQKLLKDLPCPFPNHPVLQPGQSESKTAAPTNTVATQPAAATPAADMSLDDDLPF